MEYKLPAGLLSAILLASSLASAQPAVQLDRWAIQPDGSIEWKPDNRLPHQDHIEMSGEKVSLWVQYGADADGKPSLNRTMVFPAFRLLPVRTIASMTYNVTDNDLPRFLINDKLMRTGVYNAAVAPDQPEKLISIRHKGIMEMTSEVGKEGAIRLTRTLFPSVDKPLAIERWAFFNKGRQPVKIEMEYLNREVRPATERSTPVQHSFFVSTVNEGLKTVAPGDSTIFAIIYHAADAGRPVVKPVIENELSARKARIAQILSRLQLETPDNILNTAFAFAKIRGTESIYLTKGGYLHGPGGLRYYAAIWANYQAEYINPFFAFLGDEIGNRSAMNAYRWFAKYMNPEYRPIPSSIIAEGDAVCDQALDLQPERDVLRHGHPREQRVLLEHHAAIRARLGGHTGAPVDADRARARLHEACQRVEQRRLAATRGAKQADELARGDIQVDVLERVDDAAGNGELLVDVFDFDEHVVRLTWFRDHGAT